MTIKALSLNICAVIINFMLPFSSVDKDLSPPPPLTFHKGLNILDGDPLWQGGTAIFKDQYFNAIKEKGFDFVRVNAKSFKHMNSRNMLSTDYLKALDWVITRARSENLTVIIDEHDSEYCSRDAIGCEEKLKAFWQQISERYKASGQWLIFEVLNEPNGIIDEKWPTVSENIVNEIRRSNPNRLIVVGSSEWNSFAKLDDLNMFSGDPNIIATFHYYEPMSFTHQGAPWSKSRLISGIRWGSKGDHDRVKDDFDNVSSWSKKRGIRIYLGEFGVYDRSNIPTADRVDYIKTVAYEAKLHGFAWSYWQFTGDFAAFDTAKGQWIAQVANALTE